MRARFENSILRSKFAEKRRDLQMARRFSKLRSARLFFLKREKPPKNFWARLFSPKFLSRENFFAMKKPPLFPKSQIFSKRQLLQTRALPKPLNFSKPRLARPIFSPRFFADFYQAIFFLPICRAHSLPQIFFARQKMARFFSKRIPLFWKRRLSLKTRFFSKTFLPPN